MKVCPECGYRDNPMWKPLAWRIYWEYADQEDFKKGYPLLACFVVDDPITKFKCEAGNFYYHFEGEYFYYQLTTKKSKRKLVRRFPKGYESMGNRSLFEKTPSEKGEDDIFQRKLLKE